MQGRRGIEPAAAYAYAKRSHTVAVPYTLYFSGYSELGEETKNGEIGVGFQ